MYQDKPMKKALSKIILLVVFYLSKTYCKLKIIQSSFQKLKINKSLIIVINHFLSPFLEAKGK